MNSLQMEEAMKRILVGVDGSPEASAAASFAASLAQSMHAQLRLAYIVPVYPPGSPEVYLVAAPEWEKLEADQGTRTLRELATRLAAEGVDCETQVEIGPAAETLAKLAAEGDVELLVVGHRGRGAMKRFLLGSVADRLVQISPRPVTVVRQGTV
jgi:nucleotide-binding universal stress UspA family protein